MLTYGTIVMLQNSVHCGVYPAPLQSLWATVGALAAVHFSGVVAVPYDIVERVVALMPEWVERCNVKDSFREEKNELSSV